MAKYAHMLHEEPLYTVAFCKAELVRVQALIRDISAKPASASSKGAGSAHYMGRLSDLRKDRDFWLRELEDATRWEQSLSTKPRAGAATGNRMSGAYDLDMIRQMVGFGACGANSLWLPETPNFVRIRTSGGTLNHLDEQEGGTPSELAFVAVEGVADRDLAELAVGDFERVSLMIRTSSRLLERGDEVRREPADGERFKVFDVDIVRVGGQVVCFNWMLERLAGS